MRTPTITLVWEADGLEIDLLPLQGLWTEEQSIRLTDQTNRLIEFADGAEDVDAAQAEPKIMYANHDQDTEHNLIFLYDNAAHRPALPQLEHRHTRLGVEAHPVPTLAEVLDQILR